LTELWNALERTTRLNSVVRRMALRAAFKAVSSDRTPNGRSHSPSLPLAFRLRAELDLGAGVRVAFAQRGEDYAKS